MTGRGSWDTGHPTAPHPFILTPAALLRQPPVAGGALTALGSSSPWPAVALPTLGVALGTLRSRSTGTRAAAPAVLEAEVSFLRYRALSGSALAGPQAPPPPRPTRKPYPTAVTAWPRHSCLAHAVPTVGVAGLCPARGAVTPCTRGSVAVALTAPFLSSSPTRPSSTLSPSVSRLDCPPPASPRPPLRTSSRPPSPPTGAVAGHQGVAVEARGAALAAGPGGVTQAAAAGAGQGVAIAEEQVGVTIAAAVAGLAGAAQHQRVPKEAGRAPGAGRARGRGQWPGSLRLEAHLPARPPASSPTPHLPVRPAPLLPIRLPAHRSQEAPA